MGKGRRSGFPLQPWRRIGFAYIILWILTERSGVCPNILGVVGWENLSQPFPFGSGLPKEGIVSNGSFEEFEQIFYRMLARNGIAAVLTESRWEEENAKKRARIEAAAAEQQAETLEGPPIHFGGISDYPRYVETFYFKRGNLRKTFGYYHDKEKEPTSEAALAEHFENLEVLQLEKPSVFYPEGYDGDRTRRYLAGMASAFNPAMEQLRISQHASETINEDDATQPQNVFRQDGDIWSIVYGGRNFPHVKHKRGMSFISHLLFHRGTVFETPPDLEIAIDGSETGSSILSNMTEEQLEEEGLGAQGLVDREGPDLEAFQSYKKRLKEINGELAEAEKNNDLAQKGSLNGQREVLLTEMRHFIVRAQKGPQEHGEEKARKRVSSAILSALASIEEHEPAGFGLTDHLRKHLTPVSFPYSYGPEQPIDWTT